MMFPRSRRSTATTCCTGSPRSRRRRPRSTRSPAGAASRGGVIGYFYAGLFRPRSGYRFTLEDSIYVDPSEVGRGIGRALLEPLLLRSAELGYRQMVAV